MMLKGFEVLELDRITLGGEIATQTTIDNLRRSFKSAKIVHIYASTEAGVGFTVRDERAGFPVEYLEHDAKVDPVKSTAGKFVGQIGER